MNKSYANQIEKDINKVIFYALKTLNGKVVTPEYVAQRLEHYAMIECLDKVEVAMKVEDMLELLTKKHRAKYMSLGSYIVMIKQNETEELLEFKYKKRMMIENEQTNI